MKYHAFLIKYAEIGIKGKNRYLFEDALVKHIRLAMERVEGEFEVKKESGRIYVQALSDYDFDEAVDALKHVFGIVWICPVVQLKDEGYDKLAEQVVEYMGNVYPQGDYTFKVHSRRARKNYPKDSKQLKCLLPFGNPALIRHKLTIVNGNIIKLVCQSYKSLKNE